MYESFQNTSVLVTFVFRFCIHRTKNLNENRNLFFSENNFLLVHARFGVPPLPAKLTNLLFWDLIIHSISCNVLFA